MMGVAAFLIMWEGKEVLSTAVLEGFFRRAEFVQALARSLDAQLDEELR